MKHKTNRQWLAENPERINGGEIVKVVKKAAGNASTVSGITVIEAIDEWLDAPRKEREPDGNKVIFTVEVTRVFHGEPPLPSTLEREAARIAENIRKAGTDGASVSKIQVLVRDK